MRSSTRIVTIKAMVLLLLGLLLATVAPAPARAAEPGDDHWDDCFYLPGLDGGVRALVADGRGNIYAAGWFTRADGVAVNGVARWDGSRWHPMGTGISGLVYALALDGQGQLYAGGSFTTAGGVAARHIARWMHRGPTAVQVSDINALASSSLARLAALALAVVILLLLAARRRSHHLTG
jgi:hypothetical protein